MPGLEAGYDPDWWVKQFVQRKGFGIRPPWNYFGKSSVSWDLSRVPTEAQVRSSPVAPTAEIAKVNARTLEGLAARLGVLHVDSIITEWRARGPQAEIGARDPARRPDRRSLPIPRNGLELTAMASIDVRGRRVDRDHADLIRSLQLPESLAASISTTKVVRPIWAWTATPGPGRMAPWDRCR